MTDEQIIQDLADRRMLVAAVDQFLSKQCFREEIVSAAVEWLSSNGRALRNLDGEDIGEALVEAFPSISMRERLGVIATLKSITETFRAPRERS